MTIAERLYGKIIVSSQAMPDEPFYDEKCMTAMMQSVVAGGASGLRVAGARDVKIAKEKFDIPIIGLTKPEKLPENWKSVVYITPTLGDVELLIEANADIIAFDGTLRKHSVPVSDMVERIHEAGKLAMADISTLQEGVECAKIGCDFISTTLSGYTDYSVNLLDVPDFELLKSLVQTVDKPVILEGRIWTVEDVRKAFDIGAHCVVIGSAITRPQLITKRFVNY